MSMTSRAVFAVVASAIASLSLGQAVWSQATADSPVAAPAPTNVVHPIPHLTATPTSTSPSIVGHGSTEDREEGLAGEPETADPYSSTSAYCIWEYRWICLNGICYWQYIQICS